MIHVGNRQRECSRLAGKHALARQILLRLKSRRIRTFRGIHDFRRICAFSVALVSRRIRIQASGKFPANAFDFRIAQPALKIMIAEGHRPRNATVDERMHELFDGGAHGCAGAF